MDVSSRQVQVRGETLEPPQPSREFAALYLLYERRGEVRNKEEIAAWSWPERKRGDVSDQEGEQCIRRLRLRLEPDPSQPHYILAERGNRYKLTSR